MSKAIIDYTLYNKEKVSKKLMGIKRNNHIIYNDDNSIINIELNNDYVVLKRENDEMISEMSFGKNSYCKYYLKEYNKCVTLDINLIKLDMRDNYIEVIYEIEKERIEFRIKYEVI